MIGTNVVTDANADGRPDIVLSMGGGSGQSQINVLINGGDGRLSQPITYAGYTPGYLWAPLTVGGPTNLPGAPIAPPSFLNFSPSAGAPLGHPLVLANQSFFSNSYWVEVNSPGSYGGHHFGFIQPSGSGVTTFSGVAFVDANGNGRQDPGELNLVNTPLAITLTDPRGLQTTQRVSTDAAGRWSLSDVGTWVQAVVTASGLSPRNTVPVGASGASYTLDFVPGLHAGYDFGIQYSGADTGSIQGLVFLDSGGGGWSPGDTPYVGVTVYVDLDGDGQPDSSDPKSVTDVNGGYRFLGLRPGNYVVRQVLPAGATQVYTSQPAAGVDVEAGQTSFAINFGDRVSQQTPDFNLDAQPDLVRVVPRGAVTDLVIDLMSGERTAESLDLGPFDPGSMAARGGRRLRRRQPRRGARAEPCGGRPPGLETGRARAGRDPTPHRPPGRLVRGGGRRLRRTEHLRPRAPAGWRPARGRLAHERRRPHRHPRPRPARPERTGRGRGRPRRGRPHRPPRPRPSRRATSSSGSSTGSTSRAFPESGRSGAPIRWSASVPGRSRDGAGPSSTGRTRRPATSSAGITSPRSIGPW